MKKWKTFILSAFVMIASMLVMTEVHAEELPTAKDLKVEVFGEYGYYSQGKYDTGVVYYQQNTGVNTLNGTSICLSSESTSFLQYYGLCNHDDDFASVKINNPADDPEFIKTPQKFEITVELTIKHTNEVMEIKIPAEVIEIQGTITRDLYEEHRQTFPYSESFEYPTIERDSFEYEVKLKNGSFITEKTWMPTNIGGAGLPRHDSLGYLLYCWEDQHYDLKYQVMISDNDQSLIDQSRIRDDVLTNRYFARLVDENNNIVDKDKNILVPVEKRPEVELSSNQTEVSLIMKDTNFPEGSKLEVKERKDLEIQQEYIAYDMNVYYADKKVQPAGPVEVSIKLPVDYVGRSINVYYVSNKGEMEKIESTIHNDIVTFKTSHFSTFAVVVEEKTNEENNAESELIKPAVPNDDEDGLTKPEVNEQKPSNLDKEKQDIVEKSPNTSDSTNLLPYLLLMMTSVLLAIVIVAKKKLEN